MVSTIRKYIKYNLALLKFLGLWTEEEGIFGTKYYWIYFIFVNVVWVGSFNLTQYLFLVSVIDNLEELTSTVYMFISCAMTNVKTYYLCQNFALFKSILSRLDHEDFQPRNERQRKKVHEFMRVHVIFQVVFIACFCLSMPFLILAPVILTKEKTLPFKTWYPFDEKGSPTLFILSYVHQSIGIVVAILANVAVDLISVGLIGYVAVECDILADSLENLYEFTKKRLEDEGTVNIRKHKILEEMNGTLLNCVKFHLTILKLARDSNKIFSIYITILFANALLAICMIMFQMNVVGFRNTGMFLLAIELVGFFNELLMYCWFGNELIAKSDKINHALYASDWVDCPKVFKKNMAFVMLRTSRRPIIMFGVNFFPLSLATFSYIVRASWSFFTMLNQVRRKNM